MNQADIDSLNRVLRDVLQVGKVEDILQIHLGFSFRDISASKNNIVKLVLNLIEFFPSNLEYNRKKWTENFKFKIPSTTESELKWLMS